MDAEGHARFAAAQGMRIIKTEEHLWAEKQKFCLESIPPHRRIRVAAGEARSLFRRGYLVLRYTCEESEGMRSAEYICNQPNYGLASLDAKARNQVRQGLKNFVVRPVDFELLRREGCAINQSVFQRQKRTGPPFLRVQSLWEKYVDYCKNTSDIEPFGAFLGDELCAYLLAVRVEHYAYTYHPFAKTSHLQLRPMNALIYCVTQRLLQDSRVRCVSYGLESLLSQPDLDKFKSGMGFQAVPVGRKILLNPLARPLASTYASDVVRAINKCVDGAAILENYLGLVEGYRKCRG